MAAEPNNLVPWLMAVGELFLESLGTGVITQRDIHGLLASHHRLSRPDLAAALRLGRLLDHGKIHLGCRPPTRRLP
ncbi:MAG: hypothetical protein VKP70_08050 [Cyanobacteriota bacterium]|nr:hypothetical protein [Cyanobacteriota bacterium]